MGFKANPEGIQRFSGILIDLTSDAKAAESYAEEWLSFGYSEGRIFATAVGAAEDAKQALVANYQQLAELQRSAASEVDKAALSYEQTDRDDAAHLDSSYEDKSY